MRVATASSKNPASHACALPQRIRAGCDKTAGLSANEYMLCLSAFVRVATLGLNVNCRVTSFATAHSRGLRRCTTKRTLTQISLPQRIRAGCDSIPVQQTRQRVSLPQRIRAGCDYIRIVEHDWDILCLSAFARVATPFDERLRLRDGPLPQRIRAGCDQCANNLQQPDGALPQRIRAGCDANA